MEARVTREEAKNRIALAISEFAENAGRGLLRGTPCIVLLDSKESSRWQICQDPDPEGFGTGSGRFESSVKTRAGPKSVALDIVFTGNLLRVTSIDKREKELVSAFLDVHRMVCNGQIQMRED